MATFINAQLQELGELWMDAGAASLQRIPVLCSRLAELAADGKGSADIDLDLLRRVQVLSIQAEERLSACLAIQTRTGSYSGSGAHELSPRIATAGWEG